MAAGWFREQPETAVLRFDDRAQVQRTCTQQNGDDHEADGNFVRDHLRGGAQRGKERVFRIRRPASHDDAVHAERRDRKDVKNADIDISNHPAGTDRDHRPRGQRQDAGHERRQQEDALVGARRDHRFLQHELEEVGERLKQTPWADHVRSAPDLHRRPDLAVGIEHVGGQNEQTDEQQQALPGHDH